ncbi:RNA-binding protein 28-like [Ruditapes philippinarum]|uniref:RNA-binding protein 28-like n=1 Tax=Ruditapes philippinarum TaxID=129788 RepID=UPI00295BD83D|nr:RNA-binding protein 28-like [Ruditapes philippinarum]
MKMDRSQENTTLFVRNIPYHFTKNELEDKFSEYGPIKQCFIVNDKVSGKSRGFGYVKFTLLEDAKKAKEGNINIEGRKVSVDYADKSKKIKRPPRKIKEIKEEEDIEESGDTSFDIDDIKKEEGVEEKVGDETKKGGQSMKYHNAKIVALRGLPAGISDEELNHCINKMGVKSMAECKLQGCGKEAHLKFKCIRDAKRAIRKLHNHSYKDSMLQAVQMSEDFSNKRQNVPKKSRVIVRNLSFQCSEDQLQKAFMNCGEIIEVKIPSNKDGKRIGFGFVQFSQLQEAKKAVEEMNSKKILGRPIAVDWALPKTTYENTQNNTGSDDSEFDEGSDSDDSSTQDVKPSIVDKKTHDDADDDNDDSDDDDSCSDDESEDGIDDKEKIIKTEDPDDIDVDDDDDDDDEDDDDDDSNDLDSDNEDKETKMKKTKQPLKKREQKSDTDDGCTLFIRNLSFDSTEEGVEEYFSQYGDVKYAKIVYNHETDHSKGIGFVRYSNKMAADECLQDGKDGKISLDGRELIVTVAVSRENAASLTENNKKEKEKKDNRNLYLAREGLVRAGTQQAEGLSKIDLDKRQKVEELKRQKLKNLNIFISPLRLCVRNIPVNVTDKELREVFKTAAGNKHAKINECRIMRDRTRTNAEGLGKSKGFAFISFSDHQHALSALRQTNNNPEIFGENKRLIVEFSLENRKALETKEKRKVRTKAKLIKKDTSTDGRVKVKPNAVMPLIHLSEKDKKLKGENVQKGLPSHWGPKIRHKPRPGQINQGKKGQNKQQQPRHQNVAVKRKQPADVFEDNKQKKQKRTRQKETVDDFDKIVNRYKNNLISKKKTDGKWFERK